MEERIPAAEEGLPGIVEQELPGAVEAIQQLARREIAEVVAAGERLGFDPAEVDSNVGAPAQNPECSAGAIVSLRECFFLAGPEVS